MSVRKVLFVCMGNICRSPSAQGSFEALIKAQGLSKQFEVDSAGTHSYHIGHAPDKRSQKAAKAQGINLSYQRARIVCEADYYHYDYLIAMDESNLSNLQLQCPSQHQHKLYRLLSFLPTSTLKSVPDPYYEGLFDEVFSLINNANKNLLKQLLTDTI